MKKFFCLLVAVVILSGCTPSEKNSDIPQKNDDLGLHWNEVQPGLLFTEIQSSFKNFQRNLIVVKIDPQRFDFSLYENKDMKKAKTLREIAKETQAPFVFNGAFFNENFEPLTFLKSGKKVLHKLSKAALVDGIFTISEDRKARLIETENFSGEDENNFYFAIQNGPIVLDGKGHIRVRSDSKKPAARTLIGLDAQDNIVVIFLKQSILNSDNTLLLDDFAHVLKEDPALQPLGLHSVLNLDGGTSTGFMLGENYYPEMNKVQNAVVVRPRSQFNKD